MTSEATGYAALADELSRTYERLHTAKEDAFWRVHMGLAEDPEAAQAELDRREIELAAFLQDPARLKRVEEELARGPATSEAEDGRALRGWRTTLACHVIPSAASRRRAEEIVALEGRLARARAGLALHYERSDGARVPAGSVELSVRLASDPDERVRRTAWEGLRAIERHVLDTGFLALVRERNALGRELGGEDYYDWKVRRVEGLSKVEIFTWLDELEERTRAPAERALRELARTRGESSLSPWNLRYRVAGDVTAEQDPYFPFARSFERWGRSFAALGIGYRGAELVLDLVDRPGKYENGFMHGPVPAWREHGRWRPARIHFSANAVPGVVGSGKRASETLFHEGGHAAHFANIDMPAPCFSQEFAPTSVAFSEAQSMLLDSLLEDADWQARYATDRAGSALPPALVERALRASQPFAAWGLRAMLAVCYGERALYELPEERLTPEGVLDALRAVERRLCLLPEGSPRPVLSVPHLVAGDSSAYYHGYVLAEMAVAQAREHFVARDGHLVDNPNLGPELARTWWRPGNSRTFARFVEDLVGAPPSAEALARRASRSVDEAWTEADEALRREPSLPRREGLVRLDATIRVVHGRETICEAQDDNFEEASERFAAWVERQSVGRSG